LRNKDEKDCKGNTILLLFFLFICLLAYTLTTLSKRQSYRKLCTLSEGKDCTLCDYFKIKVDNFMKFNFQWYCTEYIGLNKQSDF